MPYRITQKGPHGANYLFRMVGCCSSGAMLLALAHGIWKWEIYMHCMNADAIPQRL